MKPISRTMRHRLDVQGMCHVPDARIAEVTPWHRMAFFVCAVLAGIGTILASSVILYALVVVALPAALLRIHPFDLLYNHGIRYLRGTGPLPWRTPQTRFACGLASVWLVGTAVAFQAGMTTLGYVLGFSLTAVGLLVGTTDICIPSMIYNAITGYAATRDESNST
jgi:hypothetical protein